MGPLGAACAGCWGVPAPLCWREGGPVLLCIVLLSLLFFLSVAWRVRHPRGRPSEGLGVNKADGRGLWRSLHGLASLLSSVGHLCGQASQGHCGQGQAPRVPLMSLCTGLSPAALSVGCYLLPQGRNPLSPGTRPCLGGSQRCGSSSTHALGFSSVQTKPVWSYAKPSGQERGGLPHPPRCQPDGSYCE